MHLPNLQFSGRNLLTRRWVRWSLVALALLATHGLSAWHYAARYQSGGVAPHSTPLRLDLAPEEWAKRLGGLDSAVYLRAAENFAAGRGVSTTVTNDGATHDVPFLYWAPGAPVVFGTCLKLFGSDTMWPIFWFAAVAQLLFGAIAIATVSLWTRNLPALLLVAFCSGFCPPLQEWFYGVCLASSEIVALVPTSAAIFALAKGFAAYWQTHGSFWAIARRWRVAAWFALCGVLLGLNSLVRDSAAVMATFVALFLIGRALVLDRRRLALAICAAAMVLAGDEITRLPVKLWNRDRVGAFTVSIVGSTGVWYYSNWLQHDACDWFVTSGIGMGEYLDPAAAKRMEARLHDNKRYLAFFSTMELARAVWKRPLDAIAFKAVRLPVLWLGTTDMWPRLHWGLVPIWCAAFYGSLAAFVVVQIWRSRRSARSGLLVFSADRLRLGSDPLRVSLYVSDLECPRYGAWAATGGGDTRGLRDGPPRAICGRHERTT